MEPDSGGENFQFDQEQRLSRELLRQILQLKRFTLFREVGWRGPCQAGDVVGVGLRRGGFDFPI